MTHKSLLIWTVAFASTTSGFAQAQDVSPEAPQKLSRKQWKAEADAAGRAVEQLRRQRKLVPPEPSPEQEAEDLSRRAFEDDTLRVGDVVSTNRALFRFNGRSSNDPAQAILLLSAEERRDRSD